MDKFRAWNTHHKKMYSVYEIDFDHEIAKVKNEEADTTHTFGFIDLIFLKNFGILDKNGKEIFRGDRLRFIDKWEWYRGQYGPKMMFASKERREELLKQYEAEPYEERVVKGIEDYEWLLGGEIQMYWEIVGNNPELLK